MSADVGCSGGDGASGVTVGGCNDGFVAVVVVVVVVVVPVVMWVVVAGAKS